MSRFSVGFVIGIAIHVAVFCAVLAWGPLWLKFAFPLWWLALWSGAVRVSGEITPNRGFAAAVVFDPCGCKRAELWLWSVVVRGNFGRCRK